MTLNHSLRSYKLKSFAGGLLKDYALNLAATHRLEALKEIRKTFAPNKVVINRDTITVTSKTEKLKFVCLGLYRPNSTKKSKNVTTFGPTTAPKPIAKKKAAKKTATKASATGAYVDSGCGGFSNPER